MFQSRFIAAVLTRSSFFIGKITNDSKFLGACEPLEFRLMGARPRQRPMSRAIGQRDWPTAMRVFRAGLGVVVLVQALREIIRATDIESIVGAAEDVGVMRHRHSIGDFRRRGQQKARFTRSGDGVSTAMLQCYLTSRRRPEA